LLGCDNKQEFKIIIFSARFYDADNAHALKGQQHLAQGKRSDTLGQITFVSDAL